MRKQLVIPGQPVDVDLHDPQMRYGSSKMGIHHRAEMAVKVVRRDGHLVGLGGGGNFHRLPDPVPHRIDDGHVHGLLVKVWQKFAQAKECFARAYGVRAPASNIGERFRVVGVDLNPEHVQIRNLTEYFHIAFCGAVEIQIEQDIHVRSGAVAKGFQMGSDIAQHLALDIACRLERNPETRPPAANRAVFVDKGVGL